MRSEKSRKTDKGRKWESKHDTWGQTFKIKQEITKLITQTITQRTISGCVRGDQNRYSKTKRDLFPTLTDYHSVMTTWKWKLNLKKCKVSTYIRFEETCIANIYSGEWFVKTLCPAPCVALRPSLLYDARCLVFLKHLVKLDSRHYALPKTQRKSDTLLKARIVECLAHNPFTSSFPCNIGMASALFLPRQFLFPSFWYFLILLHIVFNKPPPSPQPPPVGRFWIRLSSSFSALRSFASAGREQRSQSL